MKTHHTTFLEATIKEWESSYATPLTPDDARIIATNVTDLFRLLTEWGEQDNPQANTTHHGAHEHESSRT